MKLKQHRNFISSILLLLLIIAVIFSFASSSIFSETIVFSGIDSLEVEENQTIDLLQGVSAISPKGENLQVSVDNVTCETDENYHYDRSSVLRTGKYGSVYSVEYKAISPVNEKDAYFASRKITIVPKKNLPSNESQKTSSVENEKTVFDGSVSKKEGLPIIYENSIHYIDDPEYPGERITLFCMNNELHWPHQTDGNKVPDYTEGYLKPDDFNSLADYKECMRRLSKLLYAGYPYNGERLYKIVDDSQLNIPTETEFNEMLIVPPVLQTAFPYLGHHKYTYADWKNQDETHMADLDKFVNEVEALRRNNSATENGLRYKDIASMPFYQAAFCMTFDAEETPLTIFANFYGASYFVTEKQAYEATQDAIWYLLNEYGISDNNLSTMSLPLSNILYTYSEHGGLLESEPNINDVHLSGDLKFTYNPKDKMWHSGTLRLVEPTEYNGLYRLVLPKGMTALCEHVTYVYGNEDYELICDHQPTDGETFGIQAEFTWLKEIKQYSPISDVQVGGKKFQNMIGAVIRTSNLSANVPIGVDEVGGLSITKNVIGEEDCNKEFQFELQLPYHTGINGLYGDLEFHKGVAKFSLKDGETVTASYLPAGAEYKVTELETGEYKIGSTNNQGTIEKDNIKQVIFTNEKYHDLSLSKTVTGETGDKKQQFTFIINLNYPDGKPFDGTFSYVGSVKNGFEHETIKPMDGTMTFQNGTAEISLSHGQRITLQNLPPNISYVVKEKEENQNHYRTTYNGKSDHITGVLGKNIEIDVVNNKNFTPGTEIEDNNSDTGKGNSNNHSTEADQAKTPDTEVGKTNNRGIQTENIASSNSSSSVKTGNQTNILLYMCTGIGALFAIVVLFYLKKMNYENSKKYLKK